MIDCLNPLGARSSSGKIRRGLQGDQHSYLPIQCGPECPEKITCLLRKTCAFDETDQQRKSWFLKPPNQLFMLLIVNSLGAVFFIRYFV